MVRSSTGNYMPTESHTIEMKLIPVCRAGICCHELDGEAVLYDPAHHALHYLNTTAMFIWKNCDGHTTVGEFLAQAMNSFSFDGEETTLREDLMSAMLNLAENGLIDWGQLQAA